MIDENHKLNSRKDVKKMKDKKKKKNKKKKDREEKCTNEVKRKTEEEKGQSKREDNTTEELGEDCNIKESPKIINKNKKSGRDEELLNEMKRKTEEENEEQSKVEDNTNEELGKGLKEDELNEVKERLVSKINKEKKQSNEDKEILNTEESIITSSSFESLGVLSSLCDAAGKAGWSYATRIQKETIPYALQGRDIIGLAETGSGKTGAFTLPILQALLEDPNHRKSIYAVVLAPTRELAFQIHDVFNALGGGIGATCVCIVGGVDMTSQSIALAKIPHIIVSTPGRLVDHLQNTKGFTLRHIKYLILDEADRMLSLDFEEEINQILEVIPDSSQSRKTMLFSATMTSKVQKLQRASLSNPIRIEVSTKFQTPSTLLQYYMFLPAKYKDCYFTYLVNEFSGKSVLVFVATCNNAQRLALLLRNLGMSAICLHGQMNQSKRLGALHKFKAASRDILICTDVASRGLDIPHVDVVINYDLPNHGKDYIHRVGRTARAGKTGQAFSLVTQYDVEVYQRVEALLGKKLPEYKLEEEIVLILLQRVTEAQRLATRELRELLATSKQNKRTRGATFTDDDGVEAVLNEEFERKGFYAGGSGGYGGALPNQRGSGKNKKKYRH